MSDDDHVANSRHRQGFTPILWSICVLVLLYILSAGPVIKLIQKKRISGQTALIYTPLTVLNKIPVIDEFWYFYVYTVWSLPVVEIPDDYIRFP